MSERTTGLAAWGGEEGKTTRGGLLRAGGVAALGTAGALALAGRASGRETASSGSILDKWTSSKKADLGVDLTFPPLQFIDPKTKKPSGYMVEITDLMMSDLGVTPELRPDPVRAAVRRSRRRASSTWSGSPRRSCPRRALQGYFAGVPVFYESNVVLVKKSSSAHT